MNKKELIKKITEKKEFSNLPKKDVELVLDKLNKKEYIDQEKIKQTRDLLRKVFSAFTSQKLLSPKDKNPEWILKKHISTKERFQFYKEVYNKLLKKEKIIFDLGAGVNGFSYKYFPYKTKYIGVEAVGQLTDLMNTYFKKEKINAKAIHESLFNLEKIKSIIKKESEKENKIIFLFKTLDSLEMVERNYSKKLLQELTPLANKIVVSFATKSLIAKKKFKVNRNWIINFIKEKFNIIEDFEIGGERYIVFKN